MPINPPTFQVSSLSGIASLIGAARGNNSGGSSILDAITRSAINAKFQGDLIKQQNEAIAERQLDARIFAKNSRVEEGLANLTLLELDADLEEFITTERDLRGLPAMNPQEFTLTSLDPDIEGRKIRIIGRSVFDDAQRSRELRKPVEGFVDPSGDTLTVEEVTFQNTLNNLDAFRQADEAGTESLVISAAQLLDLDLTSQEAFSNVLSQASEVDNEREQAALRTIVKDMQTMAGFQLDAARNSALIAQTGSARQISLDNRMAATRTKIFQSVYKGPLGQALDVPIPNDPDGGFFIRRGRVVAESGLALALAAFQNGVFEGSPESRVMLANITAAQTDGGPLLGIAEQVNAVFLEASAATAEGVKNTAAAKNLIGISRHLEGDELEELRRELSEARGDRDSSDDIIPIDFTEVDVGDALEGSSIGRAMAAAVGLSIGAFPVGSFAQFQGGIPAGTITPLEPEVLRMLELLQGKTAFDMPQSSFNDLVRQDAAVPRSGEPASVPAGPSTRAIPQRLRSQADTVRSARPLIDSLTAQVGRRLQGGGENEQAVLDDEMFFLSGTPQNIAAEARRRIGATPEDREAAEGDVDKLQTIEEDLMLYLKIVDIFDNEGPQILGRFVEIVLREISGRQ